MKEIQFKQTYKIAQEQQDMVLTQIKLGTYWRAYLLFDRVHADTQDELIEPILSLVND